LYELFGSNLSKSWLKSRLGTYGSWLISTLFEAFFLIKYQFANFFVFCAMKHSILLACCCCLATFASAQEEFYYANWTYVDYIKTIRLNPAGLPLTMPLVELNRGTLLLEFDDMDADVKTYTYKVFPCNADWTPNEYLLVNDYIDGYEEDFLREFYNSHNTFTPYTHWVLSLPGGNMKLTKSGNYVLVVYVDNGNGKEVAISRRFMISENQVGASFKQNYPADVKKMRSHHEFDLTAGIKGFKMSNPQIEVSTTVVQNGRWDNAIMGIRPNFVTTEQLRFDWQDRIVFEAGREWRWFDCRSVRFKTGQTSDIVHTDDFYTLTLRKQEDRSDLTYVLDRDINGDFLIENQDFKGSNAGIEADYVNVYFRYKSKPLKNEALYVMGAMTEWMPKDDWKMTYNADSSFYELSATVKQGFYNYAFVPVASFDETYDWLAFEGNWQETNNTYTMIIYYKPFGSQYHRIIGATSYDSIRF
jgi:Domain of unknown function (DUF5103)